MRKTKLIVIGSLMLCGLLSGIAHQAVAADGQVSPADILFMLIGVFLIFWWYRLDANERNYRASPLLNVSVVAVSLLALPYYFFRTRGFTRGLLASAVFLGLGIANALLQYAGTYAAYLIQES